ncbi:hypothetical protein VNO78_17951 [Psophocarpus tetragonolobus]|uniref:Uncharacterized protein n=1 Tax=Psophocarpus tetragonolobus TaxID=3891 RepID=A0AAN9XL12_PSOTE
MLIAKRCIYTITGTVKSAVCESVWMDGLLNSNVPWTSKYNALKFNEICAHDLLSNHTPLSRHLSSLLI